MSFPPRPPTSSNPTRRPTTGRAQTASTTSGSVRPLAAEPKTRVVPSRFLQSSVANTPPPRPSLDQASSLYTSLYTLGSLRNQSIESDTKYSKTLAALEKEVGALEREVGETRERREVEKDLDLLRELEGDRDLGRTLGRLAGALEESKVLVEGLEERHVGASKGREGIYQLQLSLAQCLTRLQQHNVASLPLFAKLYPCFVDIAQQRLAVLANVRGEMTERYPFLVIYAPKASTGPSVDLSRRRLESTQRHSTRPRRSSCSRRYCPGQRRARSSGTLQRSDDGTLLVGICNFAREIRTSSLPLRLVRDRILAPASLETALLKTNGKSDD